MSDEMNELGEEENKPSIESVKEDEKLTPAEVAGQIRELLRGREHSNSVEILRELREERMSKYDNF